MTHLAKLVPSARGLLMFEAAARTRSFTAAAAEFNVTQPSVSRSVAQLEAALGFLLFQRQPTGLSLTANGAELFAIAQESFERLERTILSLKERNQSIKPVITLAMSSSFVASWLVPRLREFHASFPSVDLRFDLLPGALRGVPANVDLATRVVADDNPEFNWWDLAPEIIVPVCSPAYFEKHGLLDHDGDGSGHIFLHLTDHDLAQWGTVWGKVSNRATTKGTWLEFSDYAVILQAALNGEGIALGWISVITDALRRGSLVHASTRQINTGHYHRLVAPKSRPLSPVVSSIRDWLIDRMAVDMESIRPLIEPAVWNGAEKMIIAGATARGELHST